MVLLPEVGDVGWGDTLNDWLLVGHETDGTTIGNTDGWTDDSVNTWTRTADQTFTVSGDRTEVFSKGTRLKWTQTTVKYGTVILSSHAAGITTVTIATTTDYVLTAAAISLNYYSYAINPQGYPAFFNYTPAWTSTGTAPALVNGTLGGCFQVYGDMCSVSARFVAGSSTTFGTGVYSFSYPITEADLGISTYPGLAWAFDASTGSYPGFWRAQNVGQLATVPTTFWSNTVPFTWNSTDTAEFRHNYRI